MVLYALLYLRRVRGVIYELGEGVIYDSLRNIGGQNYNVTFRYIGGEGGQKWPKSAFT